MFGRKSSSKSRPKIAVKYSAARLHDKGVVLDIEGLPQSQYVDVTALQCWLLLFEPR